MPLLLALPLSMALMLVLMVGIFLFKAGDMVSRVWLLTWFLAGAVMLVFYRLLLRSVVQRMTAQGRLKRRTVIVGGGADAALLIEQIGHKHLQNMAGRVDLHGRLQNLLAGFYLVRRRCRAPSSSRRRRIWR